MRAQSSQPGEPDAIDGRGLAAAIGRLLQPRRACTASLQRACRCLTEHWFSVWLARSLPDLACGMQSPATLQPGLSEHCKPSGLGSR